MFDILLGPAARRRLGRCERPPGEASRLPFASCSRLRSTRPNPKFEGKRATGYLLSCCEPAIFSLRLPWHPPIAQHTSSHAGSGHCRNTAPSFPYCSLNNRKQGETP
jgi:hypothetical protein